jgi:hypothetical protein
MKKDAEPRHMYIGAEIIQYIDDINDIKKSTRACRKNEKE